MVMSHYKAFSPNLLCVLIFFQNTRPEANFRLFFYLEFEAKKGRFFPLS